ncbi:uncharacterized protein LOC109855954 isoform X3 [Pseudomyrmex gracilis]|uniref:uncharacterized protein LOC109855954 isoform X3 n=1 Tax=Pseudomyrmex gracilis TaxID=219809 RepID=UPI0009951737|nr:uncharacterized protein LOC109855954 isoform X3 [Pseudomyrmex gracilis]XP_020286286.1 uncharacterized protein LOC109855954 isoform X3 [Pseudomyrmex gracilis]
MTIEKVTAGSNPEILIVYADVYSHEDASKGDSVMMSSSESSPPPQASIVTTDFDVVDKVRLSKDITTPIKSSKPIVNTADTEAIEEAVPIMQKTLPTPEPKPALEKNGIDINAKKSPDEPDKCLIDCIYLAQQCCECTII